MANSERLNIPILTGSDPVTRETLHTNVVNALEANAAALSDLALNEVISGQIEEAEDKTYWIGKMPYAGTVKKTITQADRGMATVVE
ncbi:MAG: hypothetical protein PHT33_02130 [bacterium]|nr:hypothetical protein [bacterium]